jgi:hypothetical protein
VRCKRWNSRALRTWHTLNSWHHQYFINTFIVFIISYHFWWYTDTNLIYIFLLCHLLNGSQFNKQELIHTSPGLVLEYVIEITKATGSMTFHQQTWRPNVQHWWYSGLDFYGPEEVTSSSRQWKVCKNNKSHSQQVHSRFVEGWGLLVPASISISDWVKERGVRTVSQTLLLQCSFWVTWVQYSTVLDSTVRTGLFFFVDS